MNTAIQIIATVAFVVITGISVYCIRVIFGHRYDLFVKLRMPKLVLLMSATDVAQIWAQTMTYIFGFRLPYTFLYTTIYLQGWALHAIPYVCRTLHQLVLLRPHLSKYIVYIRTQDRIVILTFGFVLVTECINLAYRLTTRCVSPYK